MASGPFAEVLTEAESKELIAIDQHIRSLSTLGYILRVNSTFPTLPRENNEAVKTNNVVGMLENLAQCLVRERLENASVGIVAEGQILAGELSISRRDDDVPKGEALVKELSFDQLHSATNTEKGTTSRSGVGSLAGAEFHKIKNQAQQLMDLITKSLKEGEGLDYKWPTISKLVYQYRSHRYVTL